ncbi:MAG: FAD-binding domain-containing protein [Cohaesibacteraceae bacterium]
MLPDFPPSRAAALERLKDFAPKAGRAYAAGRNTDPGPGAPNAVSMLSPYVRRRMVTEREMVAATLEHHNAEAAEKFIQEVFWRTYWKGWLEMLPSIWEHYLKGRRHALDDVDANGGLRRDYERALAGSTGIEGFDDWAQELTSTGWLHNHARMWFASIWIFTLRLPWELGADFFYQHLLDADPASNTLSWRWVAGLQTRGKTYLARPDNIEKYTNGRFRPHGLAPFAEPLVEDVELLQPRPPRDGHAALPHAPYALLITGDDLSPEQWSGMAERPPAVVLNPGALPQEQQLNSGEVARRFADAAMDDASERQQVAAENVEPNANAVIESCRNAGVAILVMPFATVGPTIAFRTELIAPLASAGLSLVEVKRSWDDAAWPRATKGFFPFKQSIPKLMSRAGLLT